MFREFTKIDWYAFAGAESFGKDRHPLIAEYGPITIVLDNSGIEVVYDEDKFFRIGLRGQRAYKLGIMTTFLKAIENQPSKFILAKLEEYGFEAYTVF